MNKLLRKKNQGFTLIELMIVVVIIGILAATAIPAFLRFVTRSKTTEAGINLKVLAEGASAYYGREFIAQGWTSTQTSSTACFVGDADTGMTIDSSKRIWDGTSGTNAAGLTGTAVGVAGLGWGPADNMYYRYLIANSRTGCGQDDAGAALTMRAHGNLDGDSVTSVFEFAMGVIPASGLGHGPLYVSSELE